MMIRLLTSSLMMLLLVACSANENLSSEELEPTKLAVNARNSFLNPTPFVAPPEALIISRSSAPETAPETAAVPEVETAAEPIPETAAVPEVETAAEPAILLPAESNHAELKSLIDNPNLLLSVELESQCHLAGDFIPFRLVVRSLETSSIFFYTLGQWKLSINNSPVGPQLAPREPTAREEFAAIAPNETFVRQEEDLGLWVQSLDDFGGIPLSQTGIGLPVGEYWITFVYSNDQDGLKEQVGGTYLIDRAAWRGTTVADEIRFNVVSDLTEC